MNTNQAIEITVEALDNGEIKDNRLATAAEIVVSQYRVMALREANKDARMDALEEQNARLIAALQSLKGAFETNVRDCEDWVQYQQARAVLAEVTK